ncbi:hypothetical protein H4R24_003210 [Coemansia sp. RSA 988]|nr:hypothetical protein H4R24_003210 [Coemansia sp. RSA 988]
MSKSPMSELGVVTGYLQRKSRFYGWSKYVFVLDKEGLAQLESEKQTHKEQSSSRSPAKVIGSANGIDSNHVWAQKVKQVIHLSDIAQISAQGKRDLCIITTSGTIVLRASTATDRDHWNAAIEDAVAYAAEAKEAMEYSSSPVLSCVVPSSEMPSEMAAPVPLFPKLAIVPGSDDGLKDNSLEGDHNPQEKMAWLPSLTDLTETGAARVEDNSICNPIKINETAPSIRENEALEALGTGLQSKGIRFDTDTGSFDVDELFDENSDDLDASSSAVAALPATASTSELRLIGQTNNLQTTPCVETGDCPDMKDLISTEPAIQPLLEETGDLAFGDMFGDFLGSFAQSSPKPVMQTSITEDFPEQRSRTETKREASEYGSRVDDGDDFEKSLGAAATSVSKNGGTYKGNAQADSMASATDKPADMAESSIADIACSFFDSVGLPELSVLGNASEKKTLESSEDEKPLVDLVRMAAKESTSRNLSKVQTSTLDPPGQHNLDGRDMSRLKSMVTIGGLAAEQYSESNAPIGIQSTLLAKYSESLSASRALLSTVGRQSRPKTMHDWQANTTKANAQRGMSRTAEIVQYEAIPSTNTGISKVVRGQLTKELIQKDATLKPAVRRVRQTKSESKVPPLKAVRLRLDGSIVGSRAPENYSRISTTRGLRYTVKDGRIENAGSTGKLATNASQSTLQTAPGNSKVGQDPDAVDGFGEIQRRLQQAEAQKRQQQQAKLLDNDASDGLRIADIIENRQDIPLAMQIEERRRMQQAKQQALLRQQLEHQRMQLEMQRLNMEQQQQQELFRRQSLCPDPRSTRRFSVASGAPSMGYGGWPDYGDGHAAHWPPTTDSFHQPQQFAQYSYQNSRPTTPMSTCGPAMFPRPGSRQVSQYVGAAMSDPRPAETHARPVANRLSTNLRRQPGSAFVKQQQRPSSRGGQSDISAVSSESWHSHVAHSTRTSLHANTEPLYEGSVFIGPPPNIAVAKRSSSFGYSDSRQSVGAGSNSRYPIMHAASNAPPVPPVPQHFLSSPAQGPPPQFQQAPYAGSGCQQMPPYGQGWSTPYANVHQPACPPYAYANNQSSADTQRMYRRRSEMSANAPSLLQQLNKAQVSGIMPGWAAAEKQSYSKGAYQNANIPKIIREGTGAHYLGDGNTLLIDRVYESEKTKRAFLKKVSRTYTGVGGDTAPTPVFMH